MRTPNIGKPKKNAVCANIGYFNRHCFRNVWAFFKRVPRFRFVYAGCLLVRCVSGTCTSRVSMAVLFFVQPSSTAAPIQLINANFLLSYFSFSSAPHNWRYSALQTIKQPRWFPDINKTQNRLRRSMEIFAFHTPSLISFFVFAKWMRKTNAKCRNAMNRPRWNASWFV